MNQLDYLHNKDISIYRKMNSYLLCNCLHSTLWHTHKSFHSLDQNTFHHSDMERQRKYWYLEKCLNETIVHFTVPVGHTSFCMKPRRRFLHAVREVEIIDMLISFFS